METKTIDEISVKEISLHCGLSIRTFYNNFQDKYDLMNYICELMTQKLFSTVSPVISISAFLHFYGEFVYDNRNFFINAFKYRGQNSFDDAFFSMVKNISIATVLQHGGEIDEQTAFSIEYFAGSITWHTKWAISQNPAPSAEVSVERVSHCIPDALKPYFA